MVDDSTLTDVEIEQLTAALATLKRVNPHPDAQERIEDLRRLVLWPTLEEWDRLYRTSLDRHGNLSLWQAVSLTSSFPSVVPIDHFGRCYWDETPDSDLLLQALRYAVS
jgi:hypothetical protein